MKVGDLVMVLSGHRTDEIGVICGFDVDDDPVVYYLSSTFGEARHEAHYRFHVEVINESR
jgi:hypothetical protein